MTFPASLPISSFSPDDNCSNLIEKLSTNSEVPEKPKINVMSSGEMKQFFEEQTKQKKLEIFEKEFKANHFRKKQPDGVFFNEVTEKFEKLPDFAVIDDQIELMMNDENSNLKNLHAKSVSKEISQKVMKNPEKSKEILTSNIKKIDLKEAMKDLNPDIVKEILNEEIKKKIESEKIEKKIGDKTEGRGRGRDKSLVKEAKDLQEKVNNQKKEVERDRDRERTKSQVRDKSQPKGRNEVKDLSYSKNRSNEKEKSSKRNRDNSQTRTRDKSQIRDKPHSRTRDKSQIRDKSPKRTRDKSQVKQIDASPDVKRPVRGDLSPVRDKSCDRNLNITNKNYNFTPKPHFNNQYNQNNSYFHNLSRSNFKNNNYNNYNRSRSPTPEIVMRNNFNRGPFIPNYPPNFAMLNAGFVNNSIRESENLSYYQNFTYEDAGQRKTYINNGYPHSPINIMTPSCSVSKKNIDLTSEDEIPVFQAEINKLKQMHSQKNHSELARNLGQEEKNLSHIHEKGKAKLLKDLEQIARKEIWKDFLDLNCFVKNNFSFNENNILREYDIFRESSQKASNQSLVLSLFYYIWLDQSRKRLNLNKNFPQENNFNTLPLRPPQEKTIQVKKEIEPTVKFLKETINKNIDESYCLRVPTKIINNEEKKVKPEQIKGGRSRSKSNNSNIPPQEKKKRDRSVTPVRGEQKKNSIFNATSKSPTYDSKLNNKKLDETLTKQNNIKKVPNQESILENSSSTINLSQTNAFLNHKRTNEKEELVKKNVKKRKIVEESDNEDVSNNN